MRHPVTGEVQTPIVEFTHSETASKVGLIGAVHIGRQGYYNAINGYIDERTSEGAIVHYEKVTRGNLRDKDNLSALERRVLRHPANSPTQILAAKLGLRFQLDALDYTSSWEKHDASWEEILSQVDSSQASEFITRPWTVPLLKVLPIRTFRAPLRLALRSIVGEEVNETPDKFSIIRESVAITAVTNHHEHHPDREVLMLWGAGHVPALSQGLTDKGYEQQQTHWLTAF